MDEENRLFKDTSMMTDDELNELIDISLDIADEIGRDDIYDGLDEIFNDMFSIDSLLDDEVITYIDFACGELFIDEDVELKIEEDVINDFKRLYEKFKETMSEIYAQKG